MALWAVFVQYLHLHKRATEIFYTYIHVLTKPAGSHCFLNAF